MAVTRAARLVLLVGPLFALISGVAFAQGPVDPYYEFLMARHLEAEGNNAGAMAALERAAAAEPKSAEIRSEVAAFYYRRNQRDMAEKSAKAALALDDKNIEANRILGLIFAANADAEPNTPAPAG